MLIWNILQLIVFISIKCFFSFGVLLFQWKTWRTMILTSEIVQDKVKEKTTSYFTSFIHIWLQRDVPLMCIHNNFPMPKCELSKRGIWMKILIPFSFLFFNKCLVLYNILFHTGNTNSDGSKMKSDQHAKNWNPGPSLKLLHFICNPVVA